MLPTVCAFVEIDIDDFVDVIHEILIIENRKYVFLRKYIFVDTSKQIPCNVKPVTFKQIPCNVKLVTFKQIPCNVKPVTFRRMPRIHPTSSLQGQVPVLPVVVPIPASYYHKCSSVCSAQLVLEDTWQKKHQHLNSLPDSNYAPEYSNR